MPFVPPLPFGWIDPQSHIFMAIDYAGLANATLGGPLGTVMDGSISERLMADGRAEVDVLLHTRNALTWAIQGTPDNEFDFGSGPLMFGHRLPEVSAGATPALGECTLRMIFLNSAPGAPLPDFFELVLTRIQDLNWIAFSGRADGPLADGTPGRLTVIQTAPFRAAIKNRFSGALSDAFPVEKITVQTTGQ
ncbi:MAG: hypothetical protein L0Y58_13875 [Verrucomicrobia subdivision 3 bacterium]|nr:hypothetical protein [Limisphaerales bacterium]